MKLQFLNLKKMTSTSRKYAIPLLEFLDRMQVTQRKGNNRIKRNWFTHWSRSKLSRKALKT